MRNRESCAIPRLMIAGTGSGSGKTTVTCALLLAWQRRGLVPAAFKAGPDYVDPMFHTRVLGVPSRNLDLFLCDEEDIGYLLARNAKNADMALIEGVMGLYDGLGKTSACSSNHLALLTCTPEVLVVSPRGQGLSLAAQLYGYLHFMPNAIKGVVLNQLSEKMYAYYQPMLEDCLGLRCYGYLPSLPEARFASRTLGLAPPEEIEAIQPRLNTLAAVAEKTLDIEGLLELAKSAEPLEYTPVTIKAQASITLAVARDEAFCFYYEDSLDFLRCLGAQIVYFSPLHDAALPEKCNGILLGGGYPEEHAGKLAENVSMRASVLHAIENGMPVMAEGGGYLYVCRNLKNIDGNVYPMIGGVEADGYMTSSLQRFGYCTLTACHENILCPKGGTLRAHEYHYGDSSDNGSGFVAQKTSGASWSCVHTKTYLMEHKKPGNEAHATDEVHSISEAHITDEARPVNQLNPIGQESATGQAHAINQANHTCQKNDARQASHSSSANIPAQANFIAGFPHIHFWGNKDAAVRFIQACAHHKARQQW